MGGLVGIIVTKKTPSRIHITTRIPAELSANYELGMGKPKRSCYAGNLSGLGFFGRQA
jgi:hypothetical protein